MIDGSNPAFVIDIPILARRAFQRPRGHERLQSVDGLLEGDEGSRDNSEFIDLSFVPRVGLVVDERSAVHAARRFLSQPGNGSSSPQRFRTYVPSRLLGQRPPSPDIALNCCGPCQRGVVINETLVGRRR